MTPTDKKQPYPASAENKLIDGGVSDQWQPIETAPKDGTEILGCHVTYYGEGQMSSIYGPWTMRAYHKEWAPSWDNSPVIDSQSDFGTDYKQLDLPPTHWMPLPKLPVQP